MQVMFNLDEYREIKKEVTNKMLMKNINSYAGIEILLVRM